MSSGSDIPALWGPTETDSASARLFRALYSDLRALAGGMLQGESPVHTLQPTALVHEAFLKLSAQEKDEWKSRSHFLAIGAMTMRRILVDHARTRQRQKRGGDHVRVPLEEGVLTAQRDVDVLAVDEALEELGRLNERHSKILELRFFGGLTEPEVAEALEISERTVQRDWFACRAWLKNRLAEDGVT